MFSRCRAEDHMLCNCTNRCIVFVSFFGWGLYDVSLCRALFLFLLLCLSFLSPVSMQTNDSMILLNISYNDGLYGSI
jgi:hypothetical protein